MGVLRQAASNRHIALGARNLVGRGSLARVLVNDSTVSAEHASIYFDGQVWKVRDLGSRNGTRVGDRAVPEGRSLVLEEGDTLVFGGASDKSWQLECDGPPAPGARSGQGRVQGRDGTLWLPTEEDPQMSVSFRDGEWLYEDGVQELVVRDGEEVQLEGAKWILELPAWDPADASSGVVTTLHHGDESPRLFFVVSRDYEHIELFAEYGGKRYELGARAHNLPLLVLAKSRLADQANGVVPTETGWMYVDNLISQAGLDRQSLNLQLWRASQWAKKKGFPVPSLVERRVDAGQLRIASEDLAVQSN